MNTNTLNYNDVVKFMKDFGIDVLNKFDELIIDMRTNTYTTIGDSKDIDDVKTRVVYALCRPIGKGLEVHHANRLLNKVNAYFNVNLTRSDMLSMYAELCYPSKLSEFKDFIKRGFPIEEIKRHED